MWWNYGKDILNQKLGIFLPQLKLCEVWATDDNLFSFSFWVWLIFNKMIHLQMCQYFHTCAVVYYGMIKIPKLFDRKVAYSSNLNWWVMMVIHCCAKVVSQISWLLEKITAKTKKSWTYLREIYFNKYTLRSILEIYILCKWFLCWVNFNFSVCFKDISTQKWHFL